MRKTWLAVLFLVLSFFMRSAFPQSFTTPPYNVPYQYGGNTYTWAIQAQIDSNNSYVFYCKNTAGDPSVDFNSSTTFLLRFGGGYAWSQAGYCQLVYTENGGTSWGNVTANGYWYFGNSEISSFAQFRSHREVKYNGYPYSGYTNANFGVSGINTGDVLISGSLFASGPIPPFFSFPLAGQSAYTAGISSVMDQSTLGTGTAYANNGSVVAFNGETGNQGPYSGSTCYSKTGGGTFGSGFAYVGTSGTGGSSYLCYDGHPGYDYPATQGTAIYAPAAGTLCAATTTTTQAPSTVWRNTTNCGSIPSVVTERWQTSGGHNAFYILHGSMFVNGSTDEYMTVFLHSNNLESNVLSGIYSDGYKTITRLQEIAAVGDIGAPGAYHIHIEFYKKVSGVWNRVDPYGNGSSNILW